MFLFLLEFGPAGVLLLICRFEKRVSQMLSQRRSGKRPHASLHARMYPSYNFAANCSNIIPDLHAVCV